MFENLKNFGAKFRSAIGSASDEILQLRNAMVAKKREIEMLRALPVPPAEVEARVRVKVHEEGELFLRRFRSNVTAASAPSSKEPAKPLQGRGICVASATARSVRLPDGMGSWPALCAADPEAAVAHVMALVRLLKLEHGPAAADRPALIDAMIRELAELEATEEAAVDEAIGLGLKLEHRPAVVQRRATEAERKKRILENEAALARPERQAAIDTAVVGRSGYLARVSAPLN